MKTLSNRFLRIFGLSALFASFAFAGNTSVPGVDNFAQILIDLAGGKVGLFFIVLIIGFSGYNAWKNANISALLWGLVASIIFAVLIPYATAILQWAKGLTF